MAGTSPPNVATGSSRSRPRPKSAAASGSDSAPSRSASDTNPVLHDSAKISRKGTDPSALLSKFWNWTPPTVAKRGQSTVVDGSTSPPARSAAVVTTLKVEPGG